MMEKYTNILVFGGGAATAAIAGVSVGRSLGFRLGFGLALGLGFTIGLFVFGRPGEGKSQCHVFPPNSISQHLLTPDGARNGLLQKSICLMFMAFGAPIKMGNVFRKFPRFPNLSLQHVAKGVITELVLHMCNYVVPIVTEGVKGLVAIEG